MKKIVLTLLMLLPAGQSMALWCGQNGVIRLSFTPAPDLTAVHAAEASEKGVTIVDVYAYLTDLDPVKKNSVIFTGVGGLELNLIIEGAEGFITSQEFPIQNRSLGRRPGEIIAGFYPGIELQGEATQLVHWQVMFQGTPEDVVFRLDRSDGITAQRTEGLAGMQASAYYTGVDANQQLGDLFAAGSVAAYLNYTGEPDLAVKDARVSWQEVGVYEAR